jgi:hypothetical protein
MSTHPHWVTPAMHHKGNKQVQIWEGNDFKIKQRAPMATHNQSHASFKHQVNNTYNDKMLPLWLRTLISLHFQTILLFVTK